MFSVSNSVCRDCSVVLERVDEAEKWPKKIDKPRDSVNQTCKVCRSPSQLLYFGINSCQACRHFFQRSKKQLGKIIDLPCQQISLESHAIKKCRPCRAKMCIKVGFRCHGFSPSDFSDGPPQEKVVKALKSVDGNTSGLNQPSKKRKLDEVNKTTKKNQGKPPEINKNLQKVVKSALAKKQSFSKADTHMEETPKKMQPKVTTKKTPVVIEKIKKEKTKSKNVSETKIDETKTSVKSHTKKIVKPVKQLETKKSKTSPAIDLGDDLEFETIDLDLEDLKDFRICKVNDSNSSRVVVTEIGEKKVLKPNLKAKIGNNHNVSTSAVESNLKETFASDTNERKRKNPCFGMKSFNTKKTRKISSESKRTPVSDKGRENPKDLMADLKKSKKKSTQRKEIESSSKSSTFNVTIGQTRQIVNTKVEPKIEKTLPTLRCVEPTPRKPSLTDSVHVESDLELDYDYADVEDDEGSTGLQGEHATRENDILLSLPGSVGTLDDDQSSMNSVSLSFMADDGSSEEEVFDKPEKSESEVEINDEEVPDKLEKSESEVEINDEELPDKLAKSESELEENDEGFARNSENELERDKDAIDSEVEENLLDVDACGDEVGKDLLESELEENLSVKDGCDKSVNETEESLLQIAAPKCVEVDVKTVGNDENQAGSSDPRFSYLTHRKTHRPRHMRDRWNRFNDDNESDSSSSSECSPVRIKEEPCSISDMPDELPSVFAMPALPRPLKLPNNPQKKVPVITIEEDSISLFAPNIDLLRDSDSLLTGMAWSKPKNEKTVPKPSSVVKSTINSVSKLPARSSHPSTSVDTLNENPTSSKSSQQTGSSIPTVRSKPCPKSRRPLAAAANLISNSTKSPKSLKPPLNTVSMQPPTSRQSLTPAVVNSMPNPCTRATSSTSKSIVNSTPQRSPRSGFLSTSPNKPISNAKSMQSPTCRQPLTPTDKSRPSSRGSLRLLPASKPILNSKPNVSPKSDRPGSKPIVDSNSNFPVLANSPVLGIPDTFSEDAQLSRSVDSMILNDADEPDEDRLSKFMTAVKSRDIRTMKEIYKRVKLNDVKLRAKMVHEMIVVYLEKKAIFEAFLHVPDIVQLEIQTPLIMKALLDKCTSLPSKAWELQRDFIDYLIKIHFVFDGAILSSILDGLLKKQAEVSLWRLIKYTAANSYSPSVKILKWVIDQLDKREDELPTIVDVFVKFQGDLNGIDLRRYIQKLRICIKKQHGMQECRFMNFLREKNYNLDALKQLVEKPLAPSNARRKLWREFENTDKLNEEHLNNLFLDFCDDLSDVEQSFKSFKYFVRGRIARDAQFKRLVTEVSFSLILECHRRKEYKSGHAVMTVTFSDGKNHFELLETNYIQSVVTVRTMALACIDICLQVDDEKSAVVILQASEGAALDSDNIDAQVRLHRLQLLKLLLNKLDVCDYTSQIYVFNCYLHSLKKDKAMLKGKTESGPDIAQIGVTLLIRFIEINHLENARTVFTQGRQNGLLMSDECFRGYLILMKRNVEIVGRSYLHFVFRVCQSENIYPSFRFDQGPTIIKIRNYLTVEEIEVILDCCLDELVKYLNGKKLTSTININLETRPCKTQLSVLDCSQEMLKTVSRLMEAVSNVSPLLGLAESSGYDRMFTIDKTSLEKFIQKRQESEDS